MHYKGDIASRNIAVIPGTAQNANRIDSNSSQGSSSSEGRPFWANGTKTDGSDENTTLIDSAQFKELLAEISAPSEASKREPIVLDSDSELTRVQFASPIQEAFTAPIAPAMGSEMDSEMGSGIEIGGEIVEAFTSPATPAAGAPIQYALSAPPSSAPPSSAPAMSSNFEEATMLARPASRAESMSESRTESRAARAVTTEPVPLSYQGDEHTAILTQDQRQDWLNHNADNTAVLSGPQVAQWLSKPAQPTLSPEPWVEFAPVMGAPMPMPGPPMGSMPMPPQHIAQGTISPSGMASDEDLFALPHQVRNSGPKKAGGKLLGNIFLGLFAVAAVLAGLAVALPAERAAVQERIFPTAKPPVVTGATNSKPIADPATVAGAKKLDAERMMSKAASAVTAGRRPEALRIYQELAAAYPSVPLYANLVHALKVSEVTR